MGRIDDELLKELGDRRAFAGTLHNILFGEYDHGAPPEKMLDDVRSLIDTNLRMHEELARLKKREGYYAQGQTLGEWADMVEESERFWSQYV